MTQVHKWLVVATPPGVHFRAETTSYSAVTDTHRLLTTSFDDVEKEVTVRLARGERIGVIGANCSQWYVTFRSCDSAEVVLEDEEHVEYGISEQKIRVFDSYDQLRADWKKESGRRTITQLASVGDRILAVFEPMLPDEHCNLFWHRGALTASTLHEPKNRRSMGFVTAVYFSPEDRWIIVFSDHAPVSEKWSIGPDLDERFIQQGFEDGYRLRQAVATPHQWLVLLQKGSEVTPEKQTLTCSMSSPKDFELQCWKDNLVVTCATGNGPPV